MSYQIIPRPFVLALFFLPLFSAFADVHLPAIFGDHMVLQRDGTTPIWGTADPGESVAITAGTAQGATTAGSDGKWIIRLADLPASTQPIEVTVKGKNTVVFHDVLVGDVWVCSGQSNMEFGIRNDASAKEEIAQANHPQIRLFVVPRAPLPSPAADIAPQKKGSTEGKWVVCTPQTIAPNKGKSFSAVGYFFGRDVQAFTGKPIGLIGTYWGGTPAQSWISLEALQGVPMLKNYADQAEHHRDHLDQEIQNYKEVVLPKWRIVFQKWKTTHQFAWDAYQANLNEWSKQAAQTNGNMPSPEPKDPMAPMPIDPATNPHIASVLFNGMIAPLIPYGIKGAIWYQGESNTDKPNEYATLLPTMIDDWRTRWSEGDFPFLIVQLANFGARLPEPSESKWAVLREAQAKALSLPHTGLAVTIDLGEAHNIHPKDKDDVGARLALAARKIAYGDDLVYSGPTFKDQTIEGGNIRLTFDHVGQGLAIGVPPAHFHPGEARPDTKTLRGFVIAGEDGKFVWADAVIDGNAVVVSSPQVPKPVAVRYGWANNPDCNLYNKEGLPAAPFRTDTYPEEKPSE